LLEEISDPELQKKILHIMFDIVHADNCLTTGEATLIALALECWEMDLCGMAESSARHHFQKSEKPIHHGSTVSSTGGSHHVATG
jgi:predicted nucleic acid-binding protein